MVEYQIPPGNKKCFQRRKVGQWDNRRSSMPSNRFGGGGSLHNKELCDVVMGVPLFTATIHQLLQCSFLNVENRHGTYHLSKPCDQLKESLSLNGGDR